MATYQVDTVAALNAGTYSPGDVIQLKRGNVYPGPITFSQSGTAGNPITITNYGDPALPQPQITGTSTLYSDALTLAGSYLVLDHLLFTDTDRAAIYIGSFAPVGGHETYFPVSNIVIQNCEMTRVGEGVNCASSNVLVIDSYIHDLKEVKNTPTPTNDDYGANGFVIGGGNNIEICYNIILRAKAPSYDYGTDGGAFELFIPTNGGVSDNISIHDNYCDSCNGVLEGGGPVNTGAVISNLSFYNNVCVNCVGGLDYFTFHNAGGSFGCTWTNINIYNNTFVEENNTSGVGDFLIYDGGQPSQISGFQLYNNIVAMNNGKYVYSQYELTTHHDNCYYFGVALAATNAAGLHMFNNYQNTLASGEFIANPLFTNQSGRDFTLQTGSPAPGMGGNAAALTATANAALIRQIQQGYLAMALPTVQVTPGSGATINTLQNGGQNTMANSHPMVIASDQTALPTRSTAGLGAMTAVPAGSTNGTALGSLPAGATGARFYLPTGSSITFTVAAAQPGSAPASTFTVSQANTGPNWDESLNGQMIYVTAITGSPVFRWY